MTAKKLSTFVPLALLALLVCLSSHTAYSFSLVPATSVRQAVRLAPLGAAEEDASAATEASPDADAPKAETKKKKKVQPPKEPVVIDVSKLDIRVGLIEKCWEHEEADKLYCEEINLGEEGGPRNIASGLKAHYSVDEMVGKKVLVLANLKSRKLVGFSSHGMVLCACKYGEAEDGSEDTVEFVCPPEDAEIGDRVVCEGFEGEPATENQVVKKKILNAVFPDLKVNAEGVAVYKDVPLTTTTGGLTCKAISLKDVPIS
jgi:aminoacyl tRNA synthase complex-interacting multifunctional protein 1